MFVLDEPEPLCDGVVLVVDDDDDPLWLAASALPPPAANAAVTANASADFDICTVALLSWGRT